jgi:hypothetical protein
MGVEVEVEMIGAEDLPVTGDPEVAFFLQNKLHR